MSLIGFLYRESQLYFLITVFLTVIANLSGVAIVGLISEAIRGNLHHTAWSAAFFILCALTICLRFVATRAVIDLAQRAIFKLRIELSRKILYTPQKRLQTLGKHGLHAILTQDIMTFNQAYLQITPLFGDCILIIGCLVYIAWLSWRITAILTCGLIIGVAGLSLAAQRPMRDLARMRDHVTELFRHIRSLIEGSKELQLNSRRGVSFVDGVITPTAKSLRYWFVRGLAGNIFIMSLGEGLYFSAIGILLFLSPRFMTEAPGVLSGMVPVLLFMITPLGEVIRVLPFLQQAHIALRKIQQLDADLTQKNTVSLDRSPFPNHQSLQIELKGICHCYPGLYEDHPFTLGPLDLTVRSGEILFIVGGNGSGKTTLAMILTGLYRPEVGVITLNGQMVTDANNEYYRQHFSAVFADFHLFEQIFDDYESSSEQSLRAAEADRYLDAFGLNYRVRVDEGRFSTIDLSYGQRKRLALIASYLEDRPVYLFDEWAADQDPVFKRLFYKELLPELRARGKAVIAITHDDSYFSEADRIITLKEGRLQSGTPINAHQQPIHSSIRDQSKLA